MSPSLLGAGPDRDEFIVEALYAHFVAVYKRQPVDDEFPAYVYLIGSTHEWGELMELFSHRSTAQHFVTLDGPDARMEGREIEALHEVRHQARAVVGGNRPSRWVGRSSTWSRSGRCSRSRPRSSGRSSSGSAGGRSKRVSSMPPIVGVRMGSADSRPLDPSEPFGS
ncbi:MAG: hypothetical protein R6W93_14475 [Candidatus Limnocylindrales bacterium]